MVKIFYHTVVEYTTELVEIFKKSFFLMIQTKTKLKCAQLVNSKYIYTIPNLLPNNKLHRPDRDSNLRPTWNNYYNTRRLRPLDYLDC